MKIDVAKHISALLYENDKVVIPELGTFLTIEKPAEINKFQELSPATKEVIFDKSNISDDDFLLQSIVRQYQISEESAKEVIWNYVNKTKQDLSVKTVSISNIGRLFLDKNKEIVFASSNTNFLNDGFGLPKLNYAPINRKVEKAEIVPIEDIQENKQNSLKTSFINIWKDMNVRMILLVCILIFLVFQINQLFNEESEIVVPSIIENKEDLIDKETNLDPYEKTIDNTPVIMTETDDIQEQQEILEEEIKSKEKVINQKPQPIIENEPKGEKVTEPKKEEGNRKNYIINIGNFSTEANANIAAADVKKAGYISYIKKVNAQKYRVGISLSSSEVSLDAKLEKIKEIFPGAWVMNR